MHRKNQAHPAQPRSHRPEVADLAKGHRFGEAELTPDGLLLDATWIPN